MPAQSARMQIRFAFVRQSGAAGAPNKCWLEREDWSGKRDLNPRPSPWQGDALPLSYSRPDRRRSGIIRASREKRQGAATMREALPGNRPDGHGWRRAIGWRRAGLTQGNREPGRVDVPAAAVLHGDLRHIGRTLLRAQTEVPPTVTVMPDQAERTAGRK